MAKYKVNVIAHQLKGNKIAKYGAEVDESELNGNTADLLDAGFIVKASDFKKVEEDKEVDESEEKEPKKDIKAELKAGAKNK